MTQGCDGTAPTTTNRPAELPGGPILSPRIDKRIFENFETGAPSFETRQQRVHVEKVDRTDFGLVERFLLVGDAGHLEGIGSLIRRILFDCSCNPRKCDRRGKKLGSRAKMNRPSPESHRSQGNPTLPALRYAPSQPKQYSRTWRRVL
jgi:hypothetical protein